MKAVAITEWTYSSKEWNEFVLIERSNKKKDSLYIAAGIVLIGTIGLIFTRDAGFWIALAISVPIAFIIHFLKMKVSYKHLKKGIIDPWVQFFPDVILVNGHKIQLVASHRKIKSIKIVELKNTDRHLLEFDIQWKTGKGPTHDEFRFLIPKDKMQEAQNMVASYPNP